MNTLRYLWVHPYGRLAILMLVVGVIGLAAHLWLGFLLISAVQLPRETFPPTEHYEASARRQRPDHYRP